MAGLNPRQLQALQAMFAQKQAKEDGLVEFRAGRAFLDEQTRMVSADKKRGKIKLVKDEQGILKLQWFNRISKQKELDLMLMPTTSKWEKVNECTDGRVYLLRMIGSNRKHFFWMQEPEEEKDDEYFKNINKLCNGQSIGDDKAGANAAASGAGGAGAAANANANAGGAFGGFGAPAQSQGSGQDAMTQLLLNALRGTGGTGTGGTGTGGTGAGTGGTGSGGVQQNLLGQMENMMREQQRQRLEEMKREPDLEDILDPTANEEIIKLLDDEKVVEELAQHLPESMRSRDDMIEQLQSPQFQGALRRLQSAINGPQMPTLLSQMGINVTNQNQMGVSAFVNAIQPNDASSSSNDSAKKTDDDGDSSMASKDDKDKKDDKDTGKDKSSDNNDMYK